MNSHRVSFDNAAGERLSGRLDLPADGAPVAYALFAHGFTLGKNLKAMTRISDALTKEGIAVLRFDFTGLGESEGDFAGTTFSGNVDDLVAAAAFLEREYSAPALSIGHSLGGAAAILAAGKLPSVRAVATIAAPAEPDHLTHLFADRRETIEREGSAEVAIGGRRFRIEQRFLEDLDGYRMAEAIASLRRALLVFHSPLDQIVGIDNASRIFSHAKHPRSFVSLDRADHLLSDPADADYVGRVLGAWARKYLDAAREDQARTDLHDNRTTTHTGDEGFRTEIVANGHGLVADEPTEVGGTNAGPNPYDYLLAALGACTGMTLRLYADRKRWPLNDVTVRLAHSKIHAQDCAECETTAGKVDRIERQIRLDGDLDDSQRQRLLEIAERCPVHRTLHEEVLIESTLANREDTP